MFEYNMWRTDLNWQKGRELLKVELLLLVNNKMSASLIICLIQKQKKIA